MAQRKFQGDEATVRVPEYGDLIKAQVQGQRLRVSRKLAWVIVTLAGRPGRPLPLQIVIDQMQDVAEWVEPGMQRGSMCHRFSFRIC